MKAQARKSTVDHRVSVALGVPVKLVQTITQSFLDQTLGCLVEYGVVMFENFGRLSIVVRENRALTSNTMQRKHFVFFKKSPVLKKAIKKRNDEVPYGKVRSGRVDER